MNQQSSINIENSNSQTHPEDWYKDEWVLSRRSIRTGSMIIDRQIEPLDELEIGSTNHHILCYHLKDFSLRQVTRMDGKEYDGEMAQGDFHLKPADCSSLWYWESTDETLVFAIAPAFLRRVALENDSSYPNNLEITPVLKSRSTEMDIIMKQFQQEMNHAEFANQMYIESLSNILAIQIMRNYCSFSISIEKHKDGLAPHKLNRVKEYINSYLDRNIKIAQLAELVDLSSAHFAREFKRSTGFTPHEYLIGQRLIKVKRLLKESKLPLSAIAHECGFTHQSHMGKIFKQRFGVTPKAYRDEFI